jgi:3-hydroxyacyl-[acyl-carrier-protein] dehydratase
MAEESIDITQIMDILPHRYPFLLVDRVLEIRTMEYIKVVKNVTVNEPFFQGHFPGLPVMPGVLILEALAQAGGVLFSSSLTPEERGNKVFLYTGVEKARFRSPVVPGDQLMLTVTDLKLRMKMLKMQGRAEVDGKRVAEAQIMAVVTDKEDF